jgi:hypothetical protein
MDERVVAVGSALPVMGGDGTGALALFGRPLVATWSPIELARSLRIDRAISYPSRSLQSSRLPVILATAVAATD